MATVHAPQSPSAQPSLLPVWPFARRYVSSEVFVDSPSTSTGLPLRVNLKLPDMPPSAYQASTPSPAVNDRGRACRMPKVPKVPKRPRPGITLRGTDRRRHGAELVRLFANASTCSSPG